MDSLPGKKWLKRCGKWIFAPCLDVFLWFFSLGLALFLVFQVLFLYGLQSGKSIPLPGRVLTLVEKQFEEAIPGTEVEIRSLSIRADGTIKTSGVDIYLESSSEPVLILEETLIDLSLPFLFIGRVVPDQVQVKGAQLYCPVLFSPTGKRERIIDSFSTALAVRNHRLSLYHLQGRALGIPITAGGSWYYPLPFLGGSESDLLESSSPALLATAALGQLLKMKPQAEWLQHPAVHFQLSQSEPGKPRLHLEARAERMILEQTYESRQFQASTQLLWEEGWTLPDGIQIQGASLRTPDWPELQDLEVLLTLPRGVALNPARLTEVKARAAVGKAVVREIPLGPFIAGASPRSWQALNFTLRGRPFRNPLELSGEADFGNRTATLKFYSRDLEVDQLSDLLSHWIPLLPESLALPQALSGQARLALENDWEPQSVEFNLVAENLAFNQQPIPAIRADGSVQVPSGAIRLQDFRADFPEGYLEGTGAFSQSTGHLRLNVWSDGFLPTQLNPILPPWWSKIFENTAAHGRLPGGNYYIENDFTQKHTLFIFGDTYFYDGSYSGLEFEEGSIRLLVQPALIEVFDLEAYHEGTLTQGSISWVYDPSIKGLKSLNWDIESGLPPQDGKKLFNQGIREIFEQFALTGSSEVSSTGKLFNKKTFPDLMEQNQVSLRGKTEKPLTYLGYPLDSLEFQADYNPGTLRLILDSVGVADGIATGWIYNEFRKDQPDQLEFDLSLLGSDRNQLLSMAGAFDPNSSPENSNPSSEDEPSAPREKSTGVIDVRLNARGPLGDIYGFSGDGFFELRDPNLARIRLLGGLSNALEETPLPLGSLALNKMASGIVLDRELVKFPSMRITGPITRIKADGDYSLLEKDLNFNVQVFLGNPDESEFLSMVTSVFRPLTYALEMNLTGTLQEPSWKFALGAPRKLRDRTLPDQIDAGRSSVPVAPEEGYLPDSNDHPPYPPPP